MLSARGVGSFLYHNRHYLELKSFFSFLILWDTHTLP
jgi:hypothetical protein